MNGVKKNNDMLFFYVLLMILIMSIITSTILKSRNQKVLRVTVIECEEQSLVDFDTELFKFEESDIYEDEEEYLIFFEVDGKIYSVLRNQEYEPGQEIVVEQSEYI